VKVFEAHKDHIDSKKQGFDIITLEEQREDLGPADEKLKKKRILPKAQVDYNIVNNCEFPEHNWKGARRPDPKKEYKKKICMDVFRDYNIISNKYWEGHDAKAAVDETAVRNGLDDKYKKTHEFNYLTCNFYDKEKEEAYLSDRAVKQKEHGKDYLNRLPPTLKARETIVFDSSKEVPEEVKRFDEMKRNQKKRYEKRYHLEEEYRDKDIETQDRVEQLALNRYSGQKYYEEKVKGFDNITLDATNNQIKTLKAHAHVKPQLSLWEKIQQEAVERVQEPEDANQTSNHIQFITREVNVDQLPMYSREQVQRSNHDASPMDDITKQNDVPNYIPETHYPPQQDPVELRSQHHSPVLFDSMNEKDKPKENLRLYNPELEKHSGLYRQTDLDDQKSKHSASVAQGRNNQDQRYSRMNSGVSNNSRLSFASEGIRSRHSGSSNKLPTITKNIDVGNPYNPNVGVDRSHRSSAVSNKSTVKKSNLIESGAFY
jgi:hypothetical protein